MKKWNLIVDVGRCHNSNNCFLSVADEYQGNDHPGYAAEMPKHGHKWVHALRKERGQAPVVDVAYLPTMCQHCDNAPCIKSAKNNAVTKRDDGIVIIDPEKSKGQRHLVDACPYGSIWWNEEKEIPQHWPFDAHLLDRGWKEPRCTQACPTRALRALCVEDEEMERIKEEEGLEELNPEYGTKPRVHYKNLYLYKNCFIGGTVVANFDGVEECLQGATITFHQDGQKLGEVVSDVYGEFKFDNLEPESGIYNLEIIHRDFEVLEYEVDLSNSVYTGVHILEPK